MARLNTSSILLIAGAIIACVTLYTLWPHGHYEPKWASTGPPVESVPELPSGAMLQFAQHEGMLANRTKANAAFVVLVRNSELSSLLSSMRQMEDRFNHWAQYDWVFLNDVEFTDEFKQMTCAMASGGCHHGVIPKKHWQPPAGIDEEKAKAAREKMIDKGIPYGESVPYRNMCRFNSGFFFRHPLVLKYDFYWRVEPGVTYYCDLTYDPFLYMQEHGKVYGFNIVQYDFRETIETLWETTKEFIELHPEYVAKDNALDFISDDKGGDYNTCHFWSNFEIGDLRFWRSKAYTEYFEFLEKKGGFYYERWGDAPVHTLGASLFLPKDKIHFFEDIGYRHNPWAHCPQGASYEKNNCYCHKKDDFQENSNGECLKRWLKLNGQNEGWF